MRPTYCGGPALIGPNEPFSFRTLFFLLSIAAGVTKFLRRRSKKVTVSFQVHSLRRVGGATDGLAMLRLGEEEGDVDDAGAAGGAEAADERRRGSSPEERGEI